MATSTYHRILMRATGMQASFDIKLLGLRSDLLYTRKVEWYKGQ